MIFDPVCASNGVTYDNQCAFDNALCGLVKKMSNKLVYVNFIIILITTNDNALCG